LAQTQHQENPKQVLQREANQMKVWGHTMGLCPDHGRTDYLIFSLDGRTAIIEACAKCLKEAEDFLLDDRDVA
jgi:hypothetical protein